MNDNKFAPWSDCQFDCHCSSCCARSTFSWWWRQWWGIGDCRFLILPIVCLVILLSLFLIDFSFFGIISSPPVNFNSYVRGNLRGLKWKFILLRFKLFNKPVHKIYEQCKIIICTMMMLRRARGHSKKFNLPLMINFHLYLKILGVIQ